MAFLEVKNETAINFKKYMCRTCLSVDRKLYPIGNNKELYRRLIIPYLVENDECNTDLDEDIFICWECRAVFIKMKLFQHKAVRAERMLQIMSNEDSSNATKSLSTLVKANTTALNCKYVCSNIKTNVLKPDREDFEDDGWNKTNSIAFVDIDVSDNCGGDVKIENAFRYDNRKSLKNKWMEKRAILNKKPKFKIIPYNDKAARNFMKVMMSHEELMKHLEVERNSFLYKSANYKCEDCVSLFSNEKSYIRHKTTKHGKDKYECDICHSSVPSKKQLEKHCRSHYYKYQCTLCKHLTYKKTEFYNHWHYTHRRKFECLKCKLGFWSRKEFYQHYKEWHQRFVCDHCGMSFKMRYCIKSHLRKKHSPFECKMCNKIFSRYNGLWLHNKVKHPAGELEKAYCVECNKHFDNVYCYKWHLNNSVVHKPRKKVRTSAATRTL